MKNNTLWKRFCYARNGIGESLRSEKSFRAQVFCWFLVVVLLAVTRPAPVWWAALLGVSGCAVAVELLNTAVEKLADHVHPDLHPAIKVVKDTAAGAVFVISATAVLVVGAFIWTLM